MKHHPYLIELESIYPLHNSVSLVSLVSLVAQLSKFTKQGQPICPELHKSHESKIMAENDPLADYKFYQ